jgi:hypothetical protein
MPFQTSVSVTQAPAVEGDFASENPRWAVPSVEGGFKAGAGGVTVARFAWADVATNTLLLNAGSGAPTGFVHRNMMGLNFNYFSSPDSTTFVIPQGFGCGEIFSGGDFWVRNTGAGAAAVGMKAFASLTTGQVQFAAAGATVSGYVETKWWCEAPCLAGELTKMSSQPLG